MAKLSKTDKMHAAFVREYLKDFNGERAAIAAGYSKRSAAPQASRLLNYANIREALAEKIAERARSTEVTGEKIIAELAKLAFTDMPDFVSLADNIVNIKDFDKLTPAQRACISQVHSQKDGTIKLKLHDKKGAIDSLARINGLFDDRLRVSSVDDKTIAKIAAKLGCSLEVARAKYDATKAELEQ